MELNLQYSFMEVYWKLLIHQYAFRKYGIRKGKNIRKRSQKASVINRMGNSHVRH